VPQVLFQLRSPKARNITNVKAAYLVGTSLLYGLRVVSATGNTINLQLLAASGAAAGGAPFEAPTAAVTLAGSVTVTYEGY